MLSVSAADVPLAGFREAEIEHLTLAYQVGHCTDDVLDRHRGIDAMLVQQVDPVGLQPPERALDPLLHTFRPAIQSRHASLDREPELCCDDRAVTLSLERPAQELLVGQRPVDFGGVKKRYAEIEGAVYCRYGLG